MGYRHRYSVKRSSAPSVQPSGSLGPTLSPDVSVAQPREDFSRMDCWTSDLTSAFLVSSSLSSLSAEVGHYYSRRRVEGIRGRVDGSIRGTGGDFRLDGTVAVSASAGASRVP